MLLIWLCVPSQFKFALLLFLVARKIDKQDRVRGGENWMSDKVSAEALVQLR